MLKKQLAVFILSFLLVPVWGLTFLDSETASLLSVFLGVSFTLYIYYFTKSHSSFGKIRFLDPIFLFGPIFYLTAQIVTGYYNNEFSMQEFLFSPILWATLILIAFMLVKESDIKSTGIIFLFCSYLYSFHLYPVYKRLVNDVDGGGSLTVNSKDFNTKVNLKSYDFLAADNVVKRLPLNGKPTLIETWNEKCEPCIKSIVHLEDFIEDSLNFNHIYLYESFGKENLTPNEVYNFNRIENKSKIFIDLNGAFYKESGMTGYPYFVFFNRDGALVDYFSGFNDSVLDEIKEKLKKINSKLNH
jgi:thiol-disulfide isomerase/thioredoxin